MVQVTQAAWLDVIPAAIVLYQPDQIVFANRAAADLTGWSPSELIGMRLETLLDGAADLAGSAALLKTRAGIIPVELTHAEVDYEGKLTQLITVRHADLYRAAIEHSVNSFYILQIRRGADGHLVDLSVVDANERGIQQTGLTRDQLIGRSVMEILPSILPDDLTGFEQVLDSGHPFNRELLVEGLIVRNGWYHVQLIPLQGDRVAVFLWDIDARKEAEEVVKGLAGELEQQVRLMDEVLSATPDAFILFDRAGRYLYVNRSGLDSSGLALEQVTGKTWRELGFPDEAGGVFEERLESVFSTGRAVTYEEQFPTRYGLHDFITTLTPIHDKDGSVIFMLNTIHDITERKRMEEELRESQQMLASIYETALAGIAVMDVNGNYVQINSTYANIYGYTAAEMLGQPFTMIMSPEQRESAVIAHNQVMNEEERHKVRHWQVVRKDGQAREVAAYNSLLVRENGERLRVAVVLDVSEQREAQRALEASEQRLTSILNSMEDAVWSVDAESRDLLYCNPALERLLGYSVDEFRANHHLLTDVVHPEDRAHFSASSLRALKEQSVDTEYRIIRRDGAVRWVHSRFWAVLNAGDARVDGIMTDITDRKSAADHAMQLTLERERVHILSNFVRDASHEFRTPLSVINTRLYLLEKVNDPSRQAEYIDGIKEQAERILKLVESLITMSRLDSLIDLHLERLELNRLLLAIAAELESAARLKGLAFKLEMPSDPLYIQGDMNELMIAFDAVWDNALNYTPPGGSIGLRCARLSADEIAVEISDTGLGISETEMPHIFERFYRADRSHSMRGFGLGLPIARKILEMHHGRIDVESSLNKGSLFRLILRADHTVMDDPQL